MTKKDITLIIISSVVLIGSIFIMLNVFGVGSSKKNNTQPNTPIQQQEEIITGKFDEDTLEKLKSFKDYGGAELNNIGRVNPFGPLN